MNDRRLIRSSRRLPTCRCPFEGWCYHTSRHPVACEFHRTRRRRRHRSETQVFASIFARIVWWGVFVL